LADPQTLFALFLLAGLVLWQARRLSRGAAERRAWRASYFDAAGALLDEPRTRIEPDGFARLSGRLKGAPIDLRAIPDTLTTRKLPALWVLATLPEPLPLACTWHLMLRPRGTETFSAFDRLPHLLPPSAALPADCAVRTDAPHGEPPGLLAQAVARLGEDRLKEVILSPKGLRLTWLAEEAPRASYLLFRDSEMGKAPLDPADLAPILDALLDLRAAFAPEPERLRA
jgi:hypothetical protein